MVAVRRRRNSLSFGTVKGVRNATAFRGGADTTAPPFSVFRQTKYLKRHSVTFQTGQSYVALKTVHRTVFKIHFSANRQKEGRSCSPLLEMAVAISHLLPRFGRKGISLPAQNGFHPFATRGSAPWTSPPLKRWTKLFHKFWLDNALNQNLSSPIDILSKIVYYVK